MLCDGGDYAGVFAGAMEQMRDSRPVDHAAKLATVFVEDHLQGATMVAVTPEMLEGAWTQLDADTGLGRRFRARVPAMWESGEAGATLRFRFRGSQAMLYDVSGPDAGQVMISVNGQERGPVSRFDRWSRYHRLVTLGLAHDLNPDEVHDVVVKIHPDQPDRTAVAESQTEPEKYDGTYMRVGGILLIGEVVE